MGTDIPAWLFDMPLTGFQMLVGGGALLLIAGILIGLRRRQSVTVQRSALTEEVTIYLGRIAEALDRIAAHASADQQVLQKIERIVAKQEQEETAEKEPPKSHAIPHSMFGREY